MLIQSSLIALVCISTLGGSKCEDFDSSNPWYDSTDDSGWDRAGSFIPTTFSGSDMTYSSSLGVPLAAHIQQFFSTKFLAVHGPDLTPYHLVPIPLPSQSACQTSSYYFDYGYTWKVSEPAIATTPEGDIIVAWGERRQWKGNVPSYASCDNESWVVLQYAFYDSSTSSWSSHTLDETDLLFNTSTSLQPFDNDAFIANFSVDCAYDPLLESVGIVFGFEYTFANEDMSGDGCATDCLSESCSSPQRRLVYHSGVRMYVIPDPATPATHSRWADYEGYRCICGYPTHSQLPKVSCEMLDGVLHAAWRDPDLCGFTAGALTYSNWDGDEQNSPFIKSPVPMEDPSETTSDVKLAIGLDGSPITTYIHIGFNGREENHTTCIPWSYDRPVVEHVTSTDMGVNWSGDYRLSPCGSGAEFKIADLEVDPTAPPWPQAFFFNRNLHPWYSDMALGNEAYGITWIWEYGGKSSSGAKLSYAPSGKAYLLFWFISCGLDSDPEYEGLIFAGE